jgi:hypothetical protein
MSWLDKLRAGAKTAQEAVRSALEREQAAFVLGQVAGTTVQAADGTPLVEAGHRIDEGAVQRAIAEGKLGSLVSSVTTAHVQDLQERVSELRATTAEGTEQANLDSVEDYARARALVGSVAGVDVTDVRGNVVIGAGTRITEEDVRRARAAGLLGALTFSAAQPAATESSQAGSGASSEQEMPEEAPPPARKRLPLLDPNCGEPRD